MPLRVLDGGNRHVQGLSFVGSTSEVFCPHPCGTYKNFGLSLRRLPASFLALGHSVYLPVSLLHYSLLRFPVPRGKLKVMAALSKALGLIPRRWRHPEHRYLPSAPAHSPLKEKEFYHALISPLPPITPAPSPISLDQLTPLSHSHIGFHRKQKKSKSNKPNQSPH